MYHLHMRGPGHNLSPALLDASPFFLDCFFFPPAGTFQLVSVTRELGKPPGIGVGRCRTVAMIKRPDNEWLREGRAFLTSQFQVKAHQLRGIREA